MKLQKHLKPFRLLFILFLFSQVAIAQKLDISGEWKGAIKILGMNLDITLDFELEGNHWKGDLDIPVQRVVDMNLADLEVDGRKIAFKLLEVPGSATFSGEIQSDNQSIKGDFSQGGATFELEVMRESAEAKAQLAEKIERIKQLADSALVKAKVPGLGFGIVKDGKILLAEGFGFKNLETKTRVTPNTLFAIGSSSKAFTTMGLALLEDEGALAWDKPVRNYIPDFEMHNKFGISKDSYTFSCTLAIYPKINPLS